MLQAPRDQMRSSAADQGRHKRKGVTSEAQQGLSILGEPAARQLAKSAAHATVCLTKAGMSSTGLDVSIKV